jgi:hypothetical protein
MSLLLHASDRTVGVQSRLRRNAAAVEPTLVCSTHLAPVLLLWLQRTRMTTVTHRRSLGSSPSMTMAMRIWLTQHQARAHSTSCSPPTRCLSAWEPATGAACHEVLVLGWMHDEQLLV